MTDWLISLQPAYRGWSSPPAPCWGDGGSVPGRQFNRAAAVEQGIQTHQHTGIGDHGRLLYLAQIPVPHGLHQRSIHIPEFLPG